MSTEQAKSFLERIKSDAALAGQVKGAKTADEVVKKATELGYSFSEQELAGVAAQLSDSELECVSGGKQVDVPMKCPSHIQ
jgi:predicted ribosomally synthesized peptide with nif11-like leader